MLPMQDTNVSLEERRADELYRRNLQEVYGRCDVVFSWLMVAQWAFGILVASTCSPHTWEGATSSTHVHVYYAALFGGLVTVPFVLLAWRRRGTPLVRHAAATCQMLWSALLIHITGGRIETHFHVFGSLAFLAFYRDWKVLLTGTVVVALDHLVRGMFLPRSVYGIADPEWWRFLEHAFWVLFEDVVLVMGIRETRREMRALAARQAELETMNQSVEQKVVRRTRELAASREQYRALVETTQAIPWEMDTDGWRFTYVGPQAEALLEFSVDSWLRPGFWLERLCPDDRERTRAAYQRAVEQRTYQDVEFRLLRNDGAPVWVRSIVSEQRDAGRLRGLLLDITERRRLELELQQAQKLESVGRLAAGIAHEINTPVQFVSDSIHFVRDSVTDLLGLIERLDDARRQAESGGAAAAAEAATAATRAEEEADLPYLVENLPKALDRSLEGLDRVATIVRSMKEFAHPDQKEMAAIDLNQAIRSTITIARNEYKYVAEVETDFGELPFVTCHAGDVNQAVLNMIVNAAHAIGDVVKGSDCKGRITIRTRREDESVVVSIADTGAGIPEEIRSRIFEPFFTTKEVGKGTGQGLAIARSVVVEKHGGELTFDSEVGKGTTFFIRLPIEGARRAAALEAVA